MKLKKNVIFSDSVCAEIKGSPQFTPLWCQIDTRANADARLNVHCPQDILKYHHLIRLDRRPCQGVRYVIELKNISRYT